MTTATFSPSLNMQRSDSLRTAKENKYNHVVAAMLSSNNMRDCVQVRDMYVQCIRSDGLKRSMICDAASRYFMNCANSNK
mmetsp:Transcript_19705/g.29012  ORF Transcript_19705/g.29012 Transcript_19705/m.29012 type:complete len:80 (+) Transcript_19705:196-435(+)